MYHVFSHALGQHMNSLITDVIVTVLSQLARSSHCEGLNCEEIDI